MIDCFLLLVQRGARWIPLVAIPAVIAGGVVSACLMLSGIKGIITEWRRPKRRAARAASPERVVQWIAPKKPTSPRQAGSSEALAHKDSRTFREEGSSNATTRRGSAQATLPGIATGRASHRKSESNCSHPLRSTPRHTLST